MATAVDDLADIERSHPAKFSLPIVARLAELAVNYLRPGARILDPFAGVGRVHILRNRGFETHGVEIEPFWAKAREHTIVGDAQRLPFGTGVFDGIITSPVYENRVTDSHNAKDLCRECNGTGLADVLDRVPCRSCAGLGLSRRNTYTHRMRMALGDRDVELAAANAGKLKGRAYWQLHEAAVREMIRVVAPGGILFVNVSNSLETAKRGGPQTETFVVERWLNLLSLRRCHLRLAVPVETPRNRDGANGSARVGAELILVVQTPTERGEGFL